MKQTWSIFLEGESQTFNWLNQKKATGQQNIRKKTNKNLNLCKFSIPSFSKTYFLNTMKKSLGSFHDGNKYHASSWPVLEK